MTILKEKFQKIKNITKALFGNSISASVTNQVLTDITQNNPEIKEEIKTNVDEILSPFLTPRVVMLGHTQDSTVINWSLPYYSYILSLSRGVTIASINKINNKKINLKIVNLSTGTITINFSGLHVWTNRRTNITLNSSEAEILELYCIDDVIFIEVTSNVNRLINSSGTIIVPAQKVNNKTPDSNGNIPNVYCTYCSYCSHCMSYCCSGGG